MNKIGLYILISLVLNMVVLTLVRSWVNMDTACILAIILYMVFTYLTCKNLVHRSLIQKITIVLLGIVIVHLPMKLIDFKGQIISFPEFICEILGVTLGLIFFLSATKARIIVVLFTLIFCSTLYLNYHRVLDIINYSNLFNKNIHDIHINSVPYFDSNNNSANNFMFSSNEEIILNIWATTCGPCIAEFEQIDSLHQLSKKNGNCKLYTACILQKIDRKTPYEIAKMKRVSFPIFTIPNWNYVLKDYGLDGVPVTFVIKNKQIKFRGSLISAWNFANSN